MKLTTNKAKWDGAVSDIEMMIKGWKDYTANYTDISKKLRIHIEGKVAGLEAALAVINEIRRA